VFPVLSSQYAVPPDDAKPSMEDVEAKFAELRERVEEYIEEEGRARRLYVFLAGHGLSWKVDNAALLTANADYDKWRGYHVAGRWYAEWFRNAAYFREIILLMDCCRTEYPDTPPRAPWPPKDDPAKADVSVFYGFATKGGYEARERHIPDDGPVRGLFTHTLLDGLDNADRDSAGRITGATLSKHIYNKLPLLAGPRVPQEPYIEVIPPHAIVWAEKTDPVRNRVQIRIRPAEGDLVEVRGPDLDLLGRFQAKEGISLINLSSGIYTLVFPATGIQQGFDVVGTTEVQGVVVDLTAAPDDRVTYVRF